MGSVGTLSLDGCKLTNQDVIITYKPLDSILRYEYTIYKDNIVYKNIVVENNKISNIKLSDTGEYKIKIVAYNSNSYSTYTTKDYKIDKEAPVIEFASDEIMISAGDYINAYSYVTVNDNMDGLITKGYKTNADDINVYSLSKQSLKYEVVDSAGNIATKQIPVKVSYDNYFLSFNQIILVGILFLVFAFLVILDKAVKLEKRIGRYTVKPITDKTESILDILAIKLAVVSSKISNYIEKFDIVKKLGKRYQKYAEAFSNGTYNGIDFVSKKIIVSIVFVITAMIIQTLRFKIISIYEIIIPLTLGYYLLDIIYVYRYYVYRKKIEKDLLQAIIIMNNCFKSGRSITQAVDIVSKQVTGAIALEFKKMSLELSFGLDIEEVFKRFADRVKLEEAAYLTSSISILNKTGGNIIKVFSSIEQTLFNRQKLNLELKSLTSSSKVIMYVLTIMPIIFVLFISFINPNYFKPLFTNVVGFVIIGVILILYIAYILVVRKIMKVRV